MARRRGKTLKFTPLPGEIAQHKELGRVRIVERSRSQGIHGATVRPLEDPWRDAPGGGMRWVKLRDLTPAARGATSREAAPIITFDVVDTANTRLRHDYDFAIHAHGCDDVRQARRMGCSTSPSYAATPDQCVAQERLNLSAVGMDDDAVEAIRFEIFPCAAQRSPANAGNSPSQGNSLHTETASGSVDAASRATTNQHNTRRTTMATTTKGRKRSATAEKATTKGKTASKAKASKVAEKESNGNGRRTHEDIVALVPEIVERLRNGETMTVIRSEYGAGPVIRKALAEKGYNTKGEKVESEEITGKGQVLAKRVAAKRREGWAWYRLELATGLNQADLKELLEEHGFEDLASGRVLREVDDEDEAPKATRKRGKASKSEDEDEDEAPARKRGRRRGRNANPSGDED